MMKWQPFLRANPDGGVELVVPSTHDRCVYPLSQEAVASIALFAVEHVTRTFREREHGGTG